MAVEIPRVNRLEPTAPTSVGRIQASAPNITGASDILSSGLESGVKSFVSAVEKRDAEIKKQTLTAWDIKTSDLSNQFERWSKERLSQIKLKDGDTTEDYVKYDQEAQEKYKELFGNWKDMTPEFQQMLDKKINNVYGAQSSFRNIQQSEQNYKYTKSVGDTRRKLDQDNFMNSGLYVDMNKPDSFLPLYKYRDDIVQTNKAQGSQIGILTAENENDYMNTEVGVQIRKDMGDTVIPLVKSLNAAGKVKEGKKIIDDFGDYLNADDKAKLLSDNDEADVRNQAITHLTSLEQSVRKANPNNPDRRVLMSDIDKIPGISDAVRHKIGELNDTKNKRMDNEKDRKIELAVNTEFERLLRKQSGQDAYVSTAEYIDGPEYKNLRDLGMSPTQLNHLANIVEAPLKSSQKALDDFNEAYMNKTLGRMTPNDIASIYPYLNKADRARFNEYRREQAYDLNRAEKKEGPVSGATMSEMHNRMIKTLEKQMISYREAGSNLFEQNSKGKFRSKYDTQMLNSYMDIIRDDIAAKGGKLTGLEEQAIVNSRFKEMIEQKKQDHKSLLSKFITPTYEPRQRRSQLTEGVVTPQGAYGPRSGSGASLRPNPVVDTPAVSTPNVQVSDSGKVTNLPTNRKGWIQLWEQARNKKFSPSDFKDYQKFVDETKAKAGSQ